MKKLLLFFLLFFTFNTSFASNDVLSGLKDIPSEFRPECYEYFKKIENTFEEGKTYYVSINKNVVLATQNNKVLPINLSYQKDGVYNNYTLDFDSEEELDFDYRSLKDGNKKTYLELTLGLDDLSGKELVLKFDDEVEGFSNIFEFDFSSNYYYADYYISSDGINYSKVQKQNVADFSFSYLKIEFKGRDGFVADEDFAEKVRISELSFRKDINGYMFMSFYDDDIEFYSGNNCKDYKNIYPNSFNGFSTDSETETINVILEKSLEYDVFVTKDSDNDKVPDEKDNCRNVFNPLQKDKNANGIGDLCSDDDDDGIIGHKDNCVYVENADQKDVNRNSVGDACEFDKDKDGIFDSLDNCINTANPDQADKDKDGIGDSCDNCKSYNPRQEDTNKNDIGDVCEKQDEHLYNNDYDKDGIIDNKDNCKKIANKDQVDFDKDGVGDVCDNCKNFQNKNQLDFNKNGVGDICEDSDNDGIEGLTDNCINVANPDQKDTDNDGTGDMCEDDDRDNFLAVNDNCPFDYNPNQVDIDEDGIGDKCDESDDRYIESNSNFFIGLIIFIIFCFFFGIYMMVRKLK